jgi:hypothetical protein
MNELDIRKILKNNFNISLDKRKIVPIDITDIIYDPILKFVPQNELRFNIGVINSEYITFLRKNYNNTLLELAELVRKETGISPLEAMKSSDKTLCDIIFNRGYIFHSKYYKIINITPENLTVKIISSPNGNVTNTDIVLPGYRGWNLFYKPTNTYRKDIINFLTGFVGEENLYFNDLLKNKQRTLAEYYYDDNSPNVYPKSDFVKVIDYNRLEGSGDKLVLKSDKSIAPDYLTGKYYFLRDMIRIYGENGSKKFFYSNHHISYFIEKMNYIIYFDNISEKYTNFKNFIENSQQILKFDCYNFGLIESEEIANNLPDVFELEYFGIFIGKKHSYGIKPSSKFTGYILPYFNNIKKEQELSFTDKLKFGIESPSYVTTGGKQYTFGVELETSSGNLPNYVMRKYNMKTMRDGSIGGHEFVTGILKGDAGLLHLNHIVHELNNRCEIDYKCGIHVHLGNTVFNKELLVVLYQLGLEIQDEVFAMMPESRRGSKYCLPLPRVLAKSGFSKLESDYKNLLSDYYRKIYNEIMLGVKDEPCGYRADGSASAGLGPVNNKFKVHKDGRWNHGRYYWLNLQPAMFATREGDIIDISRMFNIEFRNHSPSLNFKKIKNWILILMAILSFAENNKKRILFSKEKITLKEILFTELSEKPIEYKGELLSIPQYLNNYIEERKRLFSEIKEVRAKDGILFGKTSLKEDHYKEETTYSNKIKDLICV